MEKALLLLLASHGDETGHSFCSLNTLARELGVNQRTCRRIMSQLVTAGYVQVVQEDTGKATLRKLTPGLGDLGSLQPRAHRPGEVGRTGPTPRAQGPGGVGRTGPTEEYKEEPMEEPSEEDDVDRMPQAASDDGPCSHCGGSGVVDTGTYLVPCGCSMDTDIVAGATDYSDLDGDGRPRVWSQDRPCVQCGKSVEEARRCYDSPTCYACLPPPPRLRHPDPLPSKAAAEEGTTTEDIQWARTVADARDFMSQGRRDALVKAGIVTAEACAALSPRELAQRPNIGPKTVAAVQRWLASLGMQLSPDKPRAPRAAGDPRVKELGDVWQELWKAERGNGAYRWDWHKDASLLQRWGTACCWDTTVFRSAAKAYLKAEANGGVWPQDDPPSLSKGTRKLAGWLNSAPPKSREPDYGPAGVVRRGV
ncbi:MAG: hypothetical protein GY788_20995 [bacterium]|nr:hypothetical protein [bacterium]